MVRRPRARALAATLLAMIVAAIAVGAYSESLGAHSRLWSFANEPAWMPPAWLVLGSWPFEIMIPVLLSAARRRR